MMCEAGLEIRVVQREVYVWNWSRVVRMQVWHDVALIVWQVGQRVCWVVEMDPLVSCCMLGCFSVGTGNGVVEMSGDDTCVNMIDQCGGVGGALVWIVGEGDEA